MKLQTVKLSECEPNSGQLDIPSNPRIISEQDIDALARSIAETPEMLKLRPCIAVKHNSRYVVIAGNARLQALRKLGHTHVDIVVLDDISKETLAAIAIKDNNNWGNWDKESLLNYWQEFPLRDWGMADIYIGMDVNIDKLFEDFSSREATEKQKTKFSVIASPEEYEKTKAEVACFLAERFPNAKIV